MLHSRLDSTLFRCAALSCAALLPATVFAGNVYPTNLAQSTNYVNQTLGDTVTLGYLLNDDATNVTVEVLNSSNAVVKTFLVGAQAKGSQSVLWDSTDDSSVLVPTGNYTFRVNTTGAASGAWTQFNSTASKLNYFYTPRGVAVNKNPDSPYYGRVYVGEGAGGISGMEGPTTRVTTDGIYMLNADISDNGIPGGTGAHTAGVPWRLANDTPADNTPASPFRLEVGPDDSLYITDWSDAQSGLWQADPNVTSAVEVLDSTGRNTAGLNTTHGSIADVIVTGTGASRTIYTFDEDYATPSVETRGSILRYDIGTNTTFSGPPSALAYDDTSDNRVQNFLGSIALANDGTFWLAQNRAGGADTLSSLMQIDASGTVLWSSIPSLAATSLDDPLRGMQGIAYDAVNNLIAVVTNINVTGTGNGRIQIFDPVSKTVLGTLYFGSTTNTDVAFDAAGNLYVTNRSAERLRLWSPPNGNVNGRDYVVNAFSTSSLGPLGTITVVPEPASALLMVLGLVALGNIRRRDA